MEKITVGGILAKAFLLFVSAAQFTTAGCCRNPVLERDFSMVTIVEPKETKGSSGLAVEELKYHLKKVCRSQFVEGAPVKFIFARPADGREPRPCESIYRIDGDNIYFWGDDSGLVMTWKLVENPYKQNRVRNGSLFAVELFAENELGVKWIWPGDDGYLFTPQTKVKLPKRKEASFISKLATARFRVGSRSPCGPSFKECSKFVPGLPEEILSSDPELARKKFEERLIWRCRMRLQDSDPFSYGHAFINWKARFGKKHPEYLALVDGVRGNVRGERDTFVHLCVSNEGTVDQIIDDWLASGTNRYLNVCENDGTAYCQCSECEKFDVNLPADGKLIHRTDRYVQFWNRIAEKAIAIRPDVRLIAYMYNEYRLPPRKQKLKHGDSILLGAVPSMMDDTTALFNGWKAMGAKRFFLRPNHHHFLGSIPRGMERYLYRNFRESLDVGVIGFDYDAPANRFVMDIEYYITAKMLQDPDMDFEKACDEYYSGYGAAKAEVKEYFEAVRRDGERARSAFLENGEKLDHSQLSMYGPRAWQAYGRNESELKEKVALLKRALASHPEIDAAAKKRLETLILVAKHAVVTFRFCVAAENHATDMETFWDRSRDLLDFRKQHYRDLPDSYASVFRGWWGEVQQWKFLRRPKETKQNVPASRLTLENSL